MLPSGVGCLLGCSSSITSYRPGRGLVCYGSGMSYSGQQKTVMKGYTNKSWCVVLQAALAASRVSKMGYMVGWVGRNSQNITTNTISNTSPLVEQQQVVTVQLMIFGSCCSQHFTWVVLKLLHSVLFYG